MKYDPLNDNVDDVIISGGQRSGQDMESLRRCFLFFSIGVTSLGLWSCQNSKPPAVIVIAIDDFSVNEVVCNQEQLETQASGWLKVCREFIRFTHAYTTSTMTVPALASLVTGQYPFQHGLRYNSGQSLKAELLTIPEEAVAHQWRTSFFSGGAPVFRKTGLHQGFEYFDDVWSISPAEVHKPFKRSLTDFKEWYKDDAEENPFLAFFYIPDLAYVTAETREDFSLSRTTSFEAQLDELNGNLFSLFQFLENSKRWKETMIILVGLHGRSENGSQKTLKGNNLFSANTEVGLFIKPSQVDGYRRVAPPWKVDREVNLADVGKTIQEIIVGQRSLSQVAAWPVIALGKDLISPVISDYKPRPLLIESFWEPWVENSSWNRAAIVTSHRLYSFNAGLTPRVFNLLLDNYEVMPLRKSEYEVEYVKTLARELEKIGFDANGKKAMTGRLANWREEILQIPYTLWIDPTASMDLMKSIYRLRHDFPNQKEILALTLRMAMESGDWQTVLDLGSERNDTLLIQLARIHLSQGRINLSQMRPDAISLGTLPHKCFELAAKKDITAKEIRNCEDPLFSRFLLEKIKNDPLREFERFYEISVMRDAIRRYDLALGIRFDPRHLEASWPSLFEIFLALPENQKLRSQLFRKTQRKASADEVL
ncbi:MAG: sulfatase-like hydrolase/transferase [Bdellovibrionaceae bacterium]|nr:sulfatase-like hydrolase/transferase [Pseudobdellovibrionaceae bacterium]